MLSSLLQHSRASEVATTTAAATRKGSSQSTQQPALLTPIPFQDNITNDAISTKDEYPSKDEPFAKKPKLYLQDNNHQANEEKPLD